MTWLLIVFGIAVVLSPLMWLKQSPHQKRITELRRWANSRSLKVSLHRRPDAREDEVRLDAVYYGLPWLDKSAGQDWVLQRHSQRGWQSDLEGWQWFGHQADPTWDQLLADTVPELPSGVSAVIANSSGVGLIWDERGTFTEIEQLCEFLQRLRQKAEEICL